MRYDLAKRLKDADFPQNGAGSRVAPPEAIVARRDDFAYVPTLEELIEACGDREISLVKKLSEIDGNYEWRATIPYKEPHAHGSTPTEAVARLWLALN